MASQEGYYNPIIIEDTNANYYNGRHQRRHSKNANNSSMVRENDTIPDEIYELPPVIYIDTPHNENRKNQRLPTNFQNGCQKHNGHETTVIIEEAKQYGGHRNSELPPIIYIENPRLTTSLQNGSQIQNGCDINANVKEATQYGCDRNNELPPVIYIDQQSTQNTRQITQNEPVTPNPIEQTIFYDPFEDRRIIMGNRSEQNTPRPVRTAPLPPNAQTEVQCNIYNEETRRPQINDANFTMHTQIDHSRRFSHSQAVPEYQRVQRPSDLNRTLQEYQRNLLEYHRTFQRPSDCLTAHSPIAADDGFALTPLPVTEYPEPPPSYQDVILATQQGSLNSNSFVVTQQPVSDREVTVSTQDLLQNGKLTMMVLCAILFY